MKLATTLLASLIGCLFALSADASLVTFTGNTTGGPTFDRPNVDAAGNPNGLAGNGSTAVNYSVYAFTVGTSGTYSFSTAGAFDTYGLLYAGGFNPAQGLTNLQTGNDDLVAGARTSGFSATLNAGTVYSFVNTGFLNTSNGFYSASINGGGAIIPVSVPTPASAPGNVTTYTGTTVGGKTYDRVDDPGEDTPGTTNGNGVSYSTFSFQVGAVGTYGFVSNGDYDTFLTLYQGFAPSNPSAHVLGVSDDAYANGYYLTDVSAFSPNAALIPGVNYTLVTSGFGSTDFGLFSNAIVGPGAILSPVPEPDALALMLGGFGVMGIVVRRRRGKSA